ncbi:MAG: Nif3-like dinuclear metal center hexameric protein [Candidatus Thorarchaeota archaeon]
MTSLREIIKRLDILAPKELSIPDFKSRVEIGPRTEKDQLKTTINRVIVATYLSARVVTKASQEKANLVITHRPMFTEPFDSISGPHLARFRVLSKNYISTYVMGSPWIAARGGIVDAFVETIGFKMVSDFLVPGLYAELVPSGRVCEPPMVMNNSRFGNLLMSKMETESIQFSGDIDDDVQRVLVCTGDIIDSKVLGLAKELDVSAVVTGILKPDVRLDAHESGMNVFEMGMHVTEHPGMKRLKHQLTLEIPELKVEYIETDPITKVLKPYSESRT